MGLASSEMLSLTDGSDWLTEVAAVKGLATLQVQWSHNLFTRL